MKIEQAGFLQSLEHENSLPEHSLTALRWIKPPLCCTKDQQKAFAILHIADAQTANDILKEGICIDKQRIAVRKDKREPIHCARCQRFGHIARNCSAARDACGTCGNQHRTADCTASYRSEYCLNCKSQHHMSWSRECPEFKRQCTLLDDKFPENRMPYFPTEEAWTQVTQLPKPPPSPPSHPNQPSQHRQTPPARSTAPTKQSKITFPSQPRPYHQPRPLPPHLPSMPPNPPPLPPPTLSSPSTSAMSTSPPSSPMAPLPPTPLSPSASPPAVTQPSSSSSSTTSTSSPPPPP
ncbi:hypothetical protein AZE42_13669, partial [Rhizopogon vesiculosus]